MVFWEQGETDAAPGLIPGQTGCYAHGLLLGEPRAFDRAFQCPQLLPQGEILGCEGWFGLGRCPERQAAGRCVRNSLPHEEQGVFRGQAIAMESVGALTFWGLREKG